MRSGANSVQHLLTPEALGVLKHAVTEARRRGHPQVQPLHVVSMLLTHAGSRLRQACMLSHPQNAQSAECRALEVCFNVALDHLPQSAMAMAAASPVPQQPQLLQQQPILSNALMAALKRAHAHQRRGCPEHQQSPLLAVKVEIDQLIISILDDPSVSRVMKEAGFSSTNVKFNLEDGSSAVTVATSAPQSLVIEPHGVDVVSQVGSFYDAGCVISEENETKSSVKFAPRVVMNPATSMSSWPRSEVVSPEVMFMAKRATAGGHPSRDEDVQSVLDIFMRPRNRNAILIGDTTTNANAMVEDLALRIKNGNNVPAQLQGLQFLDPKLSSSSFGYCSSLEMEQKLTELSKIVEECMPAGAILHIGDLQWLAEPMQLKKGPSNFCPAQRTATELRQLLVRHANHRLWFVGVATPNIFSKLQAHYPSLTSDWGLEPVQITSMFPPLSPPFLQRFASNVQNGSDQQAMSAVMPLRTGSPISAAVQEESNERFQCCADCLAKFEEERHVIHENESLSLQLAPVKWFSLSSDEATSGPGNGPTNQVKSRSVVQQLSQLQQIWQKRCRMLHGEPMPVLAPQQLQSPLSRLSASSHSKPCVLGLDMSSRWSGQQLGSSVVDQPIPVYTGARDRVASPVQVPEAGINSVGKPSEAPDSGSPKDGSSVASADHEDPNGSTGTSVQDASRGPIHTNLALGLTAKLRTPPKSLNPGPLQPVGASPLSLKNSGKPMWLLQSSPLQPSPLQQRLAKNTPLSWQSSPLAKRSQAPRVSKSPSPPPPAPFKEFTVDDNLKGLYKGLMQRVPWQGAAVAGISATVMKCRSGMGNFRGATAKTDTWLLLLGPDSVAKHVIAKALAELVFGGESSLLHLGFGDGSCARLEVADNGMRYRGRTPIDRLVEAVRMKKSAVILLEDIDKANNMIRSSIVRAMEIGKLADSNGREVSFSNTIVVMTTSIGSEICELKPQPGSLSFSEKKLAACGGRVKMYGKIKDCRSEKVVFQTGKSKVVVVDNGEKLQREEAAHRSLLSVPSWVPKRKPENGELRLKLDGKRTKSGDGRFLNLDLNLATGGDEACEEECDSEEAKLQKVLAEARYTLSDKFCALPDYAVGFEAYDFNVLALDVLNKLGNSFALYYAPHEVSLEIDLRLLEHLISSVWKMPGGRLAFHAWLEDVFAKSVAEAQSSIGGGSVVELILAEEESERDGLDNFVALPHNIVFSSSAIA